MEHLGASDHSRRWMLRGRGGGGVGVRSVHNAHTAEAGGARPLPPRITACHHPSPSQRLPAAL